MQSKYTSYLSLHGSSDKNPSLLDHKIIKNDLNTTNVHKKSYISL